MQEIKIEGYLGKDPQVKNSNGRDYAMFSVGCSSKTNKIEANGDAVYETTWYNVFCKPEEANGLFKGSRVLVTGRPKFSLYADKNNQTRIDISISFPKIYLCQNVFEKKEGVQTQQQPATSSQPQQQQTPTATQPQTMEAEDDDLPF